MKIISAKGMRTVYSETGKPSSRRVELKWKNLSADDKPKARPVRKPRKAS